MADFVVPDDADDAVLVLSYKSVLSPDEDTGAGIPEFASLLYIMPHGRRVASRSPVIGARILAYEQAPPLEITFDEFDEHYYDENSESYIG